MPVVFACNECMYSSYCNVVFRVRGRIGGSFPQLHSEWNMTPPYLLPPFWKLLIISESNTTVWTTGSFRLKFEVMSNLYCFRRWHQNSGRCFSAFVEPNTVPLFPPSPIYIYYVSHLLSCQERNHKQRKKTTNQPTKHVRKKKSSLQRRIRFVVEYLQHSNRSHDLSSDLRQSRLQHQYLSHQILDACQQ